MRKLRVFFKKIGRGLVHFLSHWSVKKGIVTLLVLLLAIAGASVVGKKIQGAAQSAMGQNVQRTVVLQKSSLEESITVTGTVKSASITNVTSTQTAPVSEILVQEGDKVIEGQVLCKLNPESIQKEITKLLTTQTQTIADVQRSYDKAVADRDTAYNNAVAMEGSVSNAQTANDAVQTKFTAAKTAVQAYQAAYDSALSAEQAAANAFAASGMASGSAEQIDYEAKKVARESAQAQMETAKTSCDYNALSQSAAAAQSAYDTSRKTLDNLQASYKAALDSVENAASQLKKAKTNEEVTTLKEKLADCEIKASSAGTITTVNAVVGSAPGANVLFVIQDTQNLKVAVSIDEYDIKTVATGKPAIIQSDATGEAEIDGSVSQISLTATASANGAAGGFGAEIAVSGQNSGLLIGTSAKVKIIISEKKNVFSVPFDAVGADANGNRVVFAKQDGVFVPVVVTTGMETDYYIEIMGEGLFEGMEIRAFADESVLADEVAQNDTGEMGMMPGGGSVEMSNEVVVSAAPAAPRGRG